MFLLRFSILETLSQQHYLLHDLTLVFYNLRKPQEEVSSTTKEETFQQTPGVHDNLMS